MKTQCLALTALTGCALAWLFTMSAAPVAASRSVPAEPASQSLPQSISLDAAALRHDRLADLAVGAPITIEHFALDDGKRVNLDLQRFNILAPGARVIVMDEAGERAIEPQVVLMRGNVAGDPDQRVFLSVSPFGVQGFLRNNANHGMKFISTGRFLNANPVLAPLRVIDAVNLEAEELDYPFCGADTVTNPDYVPAQVPGGASAGPPPCRVASVAIETDWEYTSSLFGGNANAAASYAMTLFAAESEIYTADLNTRFLVSFLRLWQVNNDPYNQGGELHIEFRDYWNEFETAIPRNTAHLLSGRSNLPYGGIAWLPGLCDSQYGYGVSAYLNGSFPYPLQDNVGGNWDLVVVAHELGHNFGTPHTHDFSPPLDSCGLGDCNGAALGTIMSYCHTCSGGISNIALNFHPLVVNTILSFLNDVSCDLIANGATAVNDFAETYEDEPVIIDVLLNDLATSCDPADIEITSFDNVSAAGGTVSLVPAGGSVLRDQLMYQPAVGFDGMDTFTYTITGGTVGMVDVDVAALRDPDVPGATASGAAVSYYALSQPQVLPDFDALTPYASDVVAMINYPSTGGNFATSGRSDEVGAVFVGYVNAPADGLYTFFTNSDDGSALFIGDEQIVNNDGLHPMEQRSGTIALHAGLHAIRVEFFENGGGAGLIVSWTTPGQNQQVIPAAAWLHGISCGPDIDGSGEVDFDDFTLLLASWGPCPGCAADLDGDDDVDFDDFATLLAAWGPC